MSGRELPLRPHHALCLPFFVGKGYGDLFVAGMAAVKRELDREPGREVRICEACPHNRKGACETAGKTARYDAACLRACGLSYGDTASWEKLRRLVFEKILSRAGERERICSDCRWDSLCRTVGREAACARVTENRALENMK